MMDVNSLEYLTQLKEKYHNRYTGKPHKPQKAVEALQEQKPHNNHLVSYDILMELYLESARRITAQGKRPLPFVVEAEDRLNSAWRICLLGWVSLEYFKTALAEWERATGGPDSPQQTLKF